MALIIIMLRKRFPNVKIITISTAATIIIVEVNDNACGKRWDGMGCNRMSGKGTDSIITT